MTIYERKIMLVDDNRELLAMIEDTLKRNGFTDVVTAENVKEAQHVLQKKNRRWLSLTSCCRMEMDSPFFGPSEKNRIFPSYFYQQKMKIMTACLVWDWARMII